MFFKKYCVFFFLGGLIVIGCIVDYLNKYNQQVFARSHGISAVEADDWPSTAAVLGRRLESLQFIVNFKAHFTDVDWEGAQKKWKDSTKYGDVRFPNTSGRIALAIDDYKKAHEDERRELSLELTGYVDSDWDELLETFATLYEEDAKDVGLTSKASRLEIEAARRKRSAKKLGLPEDVDSAALLRAHSCLYEFLKTQEVKPRVPMTGSAVERCMAIYEPIIEHPRLDEMLETKSFPTELAALFGKEGVQDFEQLRRELELENKPWSEFFEYTNEYLETNFN